MGGEAARAQCDFVTISARIFTHGRAFPGFPAHFRALARGRGKM